MYSLRLLLRLFRRHLLSYLGGVAALAATLWMTLAVPRYLERAIDILRENVAAGEGAFMTYIWWIVGFAVAVIFTRTASRLLFFTPARRIEYELKNRLLEHLTHLQRDYYRDNPSGAIISRINNDINGVRLLMGFGLMSVFNSVGMLSLAPYYMYQISPWLTLYCALPIAVAFVVLQVAMRRLRRQQFLQMKALQDLSDFTVESYNGFDVIRSFRAFPWAEARFNRFSGEVKEAAVRMSNIRAFFMPLLTHVVNALKVMLVLVGGIAVVGGDMTMGGFTAYVMYLSMLVPPLMGMTFMMYVLQRGSTALVSLEQIFNTTPDLPPHDPQAERDLPPRLHLREGLRVEGLHYAYPDSPERPMLEDVSFAIRPGETVGLFGAIGAGKTTLVNLLNRYLTPPPGTVSLDGVDVTRLSLARLREHVVTVTQEPFLFSDTVEENVRFATETEDRTAVEQAVRAAALEEDLRHFPDGLDTLVGEKGITLSGGQKQRIALARAILKPCDLLILDDVLSAVDHETERFLIRQIYRFEHARSTLIVSHRISALERADRIVVLEQGRVTAVGTHAELTAQEGPYRQAWLFQSEEGAGEAVSALAAGNGGTAAPEGPA